MGLCARMCVTEGRGMKIRIRKEEGGLAKVEKQGIRSGALPRGK